MIGPALLYFCFAVCFLGTSVLMRTELSSEMFVAAVKRFEVTPWMTHPKKTIYNVKGGPEVYQWLQKVFVNELYAESPENSETGFACSESLPCRANEGHAETDTDCTPFLVKGTHNCPSWMSSDVTCCEPCQDGLNAGESGKCIMFNLTTDNDELQGTTSVSDLSANCANSQPNWLEDIFEWVPEDDPEWGATPPRGAARPQTLVTDPFVFCPERDSTARVDFDTEGKRPERMLMVAQYNRVVMARFTMKRMQLVASTTSQFNNAYERHMPIERFSAEKDVRSLESTASLGVGTPFNYQSGKGYAKAGGYLAYIDFIGMSKEMVVQQIADLYEHYWFDLNQGSFVLELLLFNGNVDKFLYVSFIFEHEFSGQTRAQTHVYALDLNLHNVNEPSTWIRFFLYLVIIVLFVYFLKNEFDDMSADTVSYFSVPMSVIHILSLSLTGFCVIYYVTIVLAPDYIKFQFPISDGDEEKEKAFSSISSLASRMDVVVAFLSVNTVFIFIRFISLLTSLAPDSGVVFNTIGHVKFYLLSFGVIFFVVMTGFWIAGFLLFGSNVYAFSDLLRSFITTFRGAVAQDSLCEMMEVSDQDLGVLFYFLFHMFFLIVKQPMLSIIIYGYNVEKIRMSKLADTDRFPMKRAWRQFRVFIRDSSSFLNQCLVYIHRCLFGDGDGGTMRINYEEVARLRDGRATRPRLRSVRYDSKGEGNISEANLPAKDVTLYAVEPFYDKGMMQYYVERVTKEGAAEENKVGLGFRLIGIQRARGAIDREKFRDAVRYHKSSSTSEGYGNRPEKILEELKDALPVTLEFEGSVKPLSCECIFLVAYIALYLFFAIYVSRTMSSTRAASQQHHVLTSPRWYEYNPMTMSSFTTIETMNDALQWLSEAVVDGEYACISLRNPSDASLPTCLAARDQASLRGDWYLWTGVKNDYGVFGPGTDQLYAGLDSEGQMDRTLDTLPLRYRPSVAGGMSIGYIPFTGAARPAVKYAEVKTMVNVQGYNVGFMPNNFARITVQATCYEENTNARFQFGYPLRLNKIYEDSVGCSADTCMARIIEGGFTCLDNEGKRRKDMKTLPGKFTRINYTFATEGTYGNLGGIAIGLGNTPLEAKTVMTMLLRDDIFNGNAASVVIEFVTYNGNTDMFTVTAVLLDLQATGMVTKELRISAFPLNMFSLGQTNDSMSAGSSRKTYMILFFVYAFFVVCFTGYMVYDLMVQYSITKELQRSWYMFVFDYFQEDPLNVIDTVSTVLNICVVITFLKFRLIDGLLADTNTALPYRSWTDDSVWDETVNLQDHDMFGRFQLAAWYYEQFIMYLAYNGLFMLLRMIKYFGAVPQLRLMMTTLSSAFNELAIMTLIISMIFVAYGMLCHTKFGIQFGVAYGTQLRAFTELFLYLCGSFDGMDEVIDINPVWMTCLFVTFQIIFVLLVNMYLAAVVYRWQDTRRDAQDFSIRTATARVYEYIQPNVRNKENKKRTVTLDTNFWAECSVLRQLEYLDETGKFKLLDAKGTPFKEMGYRTPALKDAEGHGHEGSPVAAADNHDGLGLRREGGQKRFLAIFKKAHMEIASQHCRRLELPPADQGAGVFARGERDDAFQHRSALANGDEDEDGAPIEIGIIEDPVDESIISAINQKLSKLLQEKEHPAEEIWLDALVTALEDARTLEQVQKFFLPAPMIKPKNVQEWGSFSQKKIKMERRLDLFLRWLQEETKIRHYMYLKDSAAAKERVLKQQSLVLTSYLEELDKQIATLQDDIKHLEHRNSEMRSHVSGLL